MFQCYIVRFIIIEIVRFAREKAGHHIWLQRESAASVKRPLMKLQKTQKSWEVQEMGLQKRHETSASCQTKPSPYNRINSAS